MDIVYRVGCEGNQGVLFARRQGVESMALVRKALAESNVGRFL